MKRKLMIFLILALLLLAAAPAFASTAGYRLSWWSVDGGGGYSSRGGYVLRGAAGQPDAGSMAKGGYRLSGGYWAGLAPGSLPSGFQLYLPALVK